MFEYGTYISPYSKASPVWLFTLDGLKFTVPFTKDIIILPSWYFYLVASTSLVFVLWVTVFAPLLKPRDEKVREKIAFWHYFSLFVYSLIACVGTAYLMYTRGEFTDMQGFFCNNTPDWYRVLSLTFTISKIWEWLDTAILVWRGKSISDIGFLHFYHHMTTFFLFNFTINNPGTDKFSILWNGFVHTLMYYHYAFRLPKIFRPLITFAQIVQLFLGTFSQHIAFTYCHETAIYHQSYPIEFHIPYLFVPVYLVFFLHFFYCTYISPSTRKPRVNSTNTVSKKHD